MRARRVPEIKNRVYHDGQPIHRLGYLQVKLVLRGSRFTSSQDLRDFSRFVARAARDANVGFDTEGHDGMRPRIREVLFLDTPDFLLYRNAYILRRRLEYQDGFLVGDPEIVFKYRHSNVQRAAEMDVRPQLAGDYRVKFKAQALPLKHRVGAFRMLFSHNVEFPLSAVRQVDRRSMATVLEVLPALRTLQTTRARQIALVNNAAVEEILVKIGRLHFGKQTGADASVALWRTRGDLQQLVGEFSFQIKLKRSAELPDKVARRCEHFFIALQRAASAWTSPGTTKTGVVYALNGRVPRTHE